MVDSKAGDLTPAGSNARTRVHEYGGGAVWYHGDTVFYSEFADSRLYRVDGGKARPITPEPPAENSLRYADGVVTPDGATIVCVRERHEDGEVHNELVTFPADGSAAPTVIQSGHDFYMAPRFDPAGGRLAWLAWDHPNMPWDGTLLYVDGAVVAGGPDESVIDPQWSPDGVLHYCSDRTGWWNLYRDEEQLTSLADAEIGGPNWVFGMSRYAFLEDGRIACVVTRRAVDSLQLLDPASGTLEDLGLGWTSYVATALASSGGRVVFAAGSPTQATVLVALDVDTGREEVAAAVARRRSRSGDHLRAGRDRVPDGRRACRARVLLPAREPGVRGPRRRGAAAARHLPRRADRARDAAFRPRDAVLHAARHRRRRRQLSRQHRVRARVSTPPQRALGRDRLGRLCLGGEASRRGRRRGLPRARGWRAAAPAATSSSARSSSIPRRSRPASATSASPTRRRSRSTRTSSSPATSTR